MGPLHQLKPLQNYDLAHCGNNKSEQAGRWKGNEQHPLGAPIPIGLDNQEIDATHEHEETRLPAK